MMSNLAQIAQLMKGKDPQAIVMQMIQSQRITDPTITQLISFAKSGDMNSVYNLADSLFKQRGLDMNQELNSFMSLLK